MGRSSTAEKKEKGGWTRILRGVVIGFSFAIAVGFLIFLLYQSDSQAKELQEQVDRQNLVIQSLRDKEKEEEEEKSPPVITSDTIMQQLNSIGELVTQEYVYRNSDIRTDCAKWIFNWDRPFSESRMIVAYDGVIKAGIDLNQMQVTVDEESKTITVKIPASDITENNIPQETITVVDVKNGLFNDITFDDYNGFIAEQKLSMELKAIERGLLIRADQEARTLVQKFLDLLPGIEEYTVSIIRK